VSIVLESFDNPEESSWVAVGSRFATSGFPRVAFPSAWPEALHRSNPDGIDFRALGVWGRFDRQGFNYIQLIPDRRDENGDFVGIPIPGIAKVLDLWVWGSMHDFYLEAHVLDQRGFTHVLDFGSIMHTGWRNLSVTIPPNVSQARRQIPHAEPLTLTKLVVWTRPWERVDNFFIYFDQIKVLTDLFVSRFDGDDLVDPENARRIWGEGNNNE
jgi:hypothetical protein